MNSTDIPISSPALADTQTVTRLELGFNSSLTSEISRFEASMDRASTLTTDPHVLDVAKTVLEPLSKLNAEAAELSGFAAEAAADGDGFTPSEIVRLTHKAQEFGFHSQLTANIANRLSDGLQQLFRQQG